MPWMFDYKIGDIVFVSDINSPIVSGAIEFGTESESDLSIDAGLRENDSSALDGGLRVIDGSI